MAPSNLVKEQSSGTKEALAKHGESNTLGKKLAEAPKRLRADGVLSSDAKNKCKYFQKMTFPLFLPNARNSSHKYHWQIVLAASEHPALVINKLEFSLAALGSGSCGAIALVVIKYTFLLFA